MKILKLILLLICASLIIWIDLPSNLLPIRSPFTTHYGLDLKGGSHFVFEADTSKIPEADLKDALESSRDIVEKRVNLFGVSEPSVQTVKSGDKHRINVDLPGITNSEDAIKLIGKTAQLNFHETIEVDAKDSTIAGQTLTFNPKPSLLGKDVKRATVTFDEQNGKPQVALEFSDKGKEQFAEITKRSVGKPVGIMLDNSVLSAPTVQQPILDGNAVITGQFSLDEAKELAISINSGALPVTIKLVEQRSIGPTLGIEEIQKSVFAGVVGLLAVMLFMILYYGQYGIVACIGLIIYGLLSLALFRAIPVVLTLPGIAGFILSIGMAVDSNILIFERIKEEIRNGQDLETAIRLGFGRAIDAIKDANFTTLLVAFILFNPLNWEWLPQFGLVRGFALTLAIGVGMSLFTGVFITKRLINIFVKSK